MEVIISAGVGRTLGGARSTYYPSQETCVQATLIALGAIALVVAFLAGLAAAHHLPRGTLFSALGAGGAVGCGGGGLVLIFIALVIQCRKRQALLRVVHPGTQTREDRRCNGAFNRPVAEQEIVNLNASLEERGIHGIVFEKDDLVSGDLTGGTCTSMSLSLADRFLKSKERLLFHFYSAVYPEFMGSNEAYRTLQAAMNTIRVEDRTLSWEKALRTKVHALIAAFPDLASDAFSACPMEKRALVTKKIQELEKGLYLVRIIRFDPNLPKKERWGHTLLLQKTGIGYEFYDSNEGLSRSCTQRKVVNTLLNVKKCFELSHLSFSRLVKNVPLLSS